ncbi:L-ribulose-5-phosphate 3-epimerase [Agromyces archimandritae]|uniref:L-ribulose-5-phosphate 3-epimerase n=1 Tax=Agromyces archimandritae TaxID=2781962 RepID=A0A975FR89_9MICO|nr:L-ribulose-5-phosphate 3-epimerase [Agromyces archimandritae]QTX05761.1 L-ribulose-5-phosphate 3-epimerase [Agromyces archimandritae]
MNGASAAPQIALGIYEKALPWRGDWDTLFSDARRAGFSFVDLSVDETPARRARLDWSPETRSAVRDAAARQGVRLGGLCLSVHRAIGPGAADAQTRAEADRIFTQGIGLCRDLGIPVLQVAGYYAYYEPADDGQRDRYVASLRRAASIAARAGVLLGIENVDGSDVTSVSRGMNIVREIDSPWVQLYPDIGNIAEQQLDELEELRSGEGHMLAIHIKDVRVGEPRRVPLGEGIADFSRAFGELSRQGWSGRMMIEMWNDDAPDSVERCVHARTIVERWLGQAGFDIVAA